MDKRMALFSGITSYDGCVFFGLNADRDGVGDVDVLAASATFERLRPWQDTYQRCASRPL